MIKSASSNVEGVRGPNLHESPRAAGGPVALSADLLDPIVEHDGVKEPLQAGLSAPRPVRVFLLTLGVVS